MPGGQETKSERAANRRAGERVVSLEVEVSALSILGKTFSLSREHMEANGGSTLLSRLVFRRTRDQERMATQWATTLKSCSGHQQELDSHLKSAPPGHCHMSNGAHVQTTQAFFFVERTHVHWQATPEQFFFSKFNTHIMFIQ